jgi:hypothetical protein
LGLDITRRPIERAKKEQQSGDQNDWYRHRAGQLDPSHCHSATLCGQAFSRALGTYTDRRMAGCADRRLAGVRLVGGMLSLSLCGCHREFLLSCSIAVAG